MPGCEQRHELTAGFSSPSPSSSLASPIISSSSSSSPRQRSSTLRPPKKPALTRLNLAPHSPAQFPSSVNAASATHAKNEIPPSPLSPSSRPQSPIPTISSTFSNRSSNGSSHGHRHAPLHSTSTPLPASRALPQSPTLTVPDHLPSSPTHPPSSLRAHLAHFLPRHAVFLVRLTVHELHNVPLVHGEFGVRWKVKGVTSPSGGGIFSKVKGRNKGKSKLVSRPNARQDKGKRKETVSANESDNARPITRDSDADDASLLDASTSISDAHSIANSSSTHSHSYDHSLGHHHHHHYPHYDPSDKQTPHSPSQLHPHILSIPSVVISANSPVSPPTPMARSTSGASSHASAYTSSRSSYHISSPTSNLDQARYKMQPSASYLSAEWHPQGSPHSSTFGMHSSDSHNLYHEERAHTHPHSSSAQNSHPLSQSDPVLTLASTPPQYGYTPSKGHTPFVKLKEHNVSWEQTLDFVIQIGIGREKDKGEKGELNACEAKLTVMQRVIPGDPDAPHNPRLGVVYLNLAQYVNAGVVTRQYLLRQSKTNATLKLTVRVEHTAGSTAYIAPLLPKGEILSGVAGILESSDAYRTRFRTLDLYQDVSSNSSSEREDPLGSDTSSVLSGDDDAQLENKARGRQEKRRHDNKKRSPFDITKLPSINDPRGTQKLIEALFNPAPVRSPHLISPFTYLIEDVRDAELDLENGGDGELDQTSLDGEGRFGLVPQGLEMGKGAGASLYADALEQTQQDSESDSDYRSIGSYYSAAARGSTSRSREDGGGSLRKKTSLLSIGSKMGLQSDNSFGIQNAVSASGVEGADGTVGTRGEKRGWWHKLKSGPA